MGMNVLVTGGLGFIGSHYVRLMTENQYDVTIIDKKTYAANIRRIEDIRDNVNLYVGDICDYKLMKSIIEENEIDTVVNFAASTHVDNAIKDSEPFIYSNYVGVWNILEIIRKNKENGNNIRFVQISTDECYGSTSYDDQTFKETDKLNPGNPYSATKSAADILCLSYVNTYGLDVIITRSSNNYGPWQDKEKFIPKMIELGMEGKDLAIYGNGNNIRDWLYVLDNVSAILTVINKGRTGDVYNIGAGDEKTNNEVAKIIAKRFGVGIKYIEDRKGHDFRYSISCNKIMEELKWEAKVSFSDGLERTIDFYVNQDKRD